MPTYCGSACTDRATTFTSGAWPKPSVSPRSAQVGQGIGSGKNGSGRLETKQRLFPSGDQDSCQSPACPWGNFLTSVPSAFIRFRRRPSWSASARYISRLLSRYVVTPGTGHPETRPAESHLTDEFGLSFGVQFVDVIGEPYRGDRPKSDTRRGLSVSCAVYAPVQAVRIGLNKHEQKDENYHSEALIRPQETDSTALFFPGSTGLAGSSIPSRK